jgi:hypothetical protein
MFTFIILVPFVSCHGCSWKLLLLAIAGVHTLRTFAKILLQASLRRASATKDALYKPLFTNRHFYPQIRKGDSDFLRTRGRRQDTYL